MTNYSDIRAATDAAEAEHDSTVQALEDATSQVQALNARLTAALNEVVVAQGERDAAVKALADYKAADPGGPHGATPDPEPEPDPEPAKKRIGMSATASEWDLRVQQVGPGVTARRLFVQAPSINGRDKEAELKDCKAKGLLPVISYKAFGNWSLQWANACATFLDSLNIEVLVVFNHEPNGDMTTKQFTDMQASLTPIFQRGKLKVGPLLNGWLLDRQRAAFESWFNDDLLAKWDFMGIDTYQSGTEASPGSTYPGARMAPLLDVLADHGHPDKPIVIGEYNGWTAEAIESSGDVWLSTPSLYSALMFNSSTGGKGKVLSGDRLGAFKKTLADPRTAK